MNNILKIDNYIIDTPVIEILHKLQSILTNGKLRDIRESATDITVTCPNDAHSGGRESVADCHINLDPTNGVPMCYFHCFACGAKGPFTKFVAHCFSSSEEYAKQWLINNYGTKAYEKILIDDDIDIFKAKKQKYLDESILDQYQSWTPYLAKRKLRRDICEKFHVKYDPKYRQVIFPVYDKNGNLLMAPKRSIDTKIFYLDKSVEKPLYGLNIIEKNNASSCLIVEGPVDCLSCWSNDVPAIATLGSPSIEQIEQINKSCIKNLYLCFDNDEAGQKFTNFVDSKLDRRIIRTYIHLPAGRKDVNDLSSEEWQELIKKYRL